MIIRQPIFRFLVVIFDGDHDFEGPSLSGLALAVGLKMAGVEDVLVIRLIEKAPALRTKSQGAMRLTTAGLARGRPRLDIRLEIELDDGSVVTASLLVGADGAFSAVRRQMTAPWPDRPRSYAQTNWHAIIPPVNPSPRRIACRNGRRA